jgi:hypothetical protein
MRDDLNNILEAFRFEFPDERTRQNILEVLNVYMNDRVISREITSYQIRDITGTSFPIDYTRLEFEIVYSNWTTNYEVITLGMSSENNRLREPIAFGTIKKHTMI